MKLLKITAFTLMTLGSTSSAFALPNLSVSYPFYIYPGTDEIMQNIETKIWAQVCNSGSDEAVAQYYNLNIWKDSFSIDLQSYVAAIPAGECAWSEPFAFTFDATGNWGLKGTLATGEWTFEGIYVQ